MPSINRRQDPIPGVPQGVRWFPNSQTASALGPITKTGTLAAMTSNTVFATATPRTRPPTVASGTLAFTAGANAGLKPIGIKPRIRGTFEVFRSHSIIPWRLGRLRR